MGAINRLEMQRFTSNSQESREGGNAPSAVAAHGARSSVRIELNHLEINFRVISQQDQSIGSNAKAPVTEPFDQ
jgi:hypothetical protein